METQVPERPLRLSTLIIGVVIGVIIAAGFIFVKSFFFATEKTTSPTTETAGILLTLTDPTDENVTSSNTTTVSGTSGTDAVIVITGGTEDVIDETKNGKFSLKTTLAEGENEITVYAFDPISGESAQTTLSILYLKEELGAKNILVAQSYTNTANENAEKIEKLKEQLSTKSSELKKAVTSFKRTHVTGTVRSIKGNTLIIETKQGNIKNVFTDDFTKFFSIDTKGRSAIDLESLKIGDLLSVMGIGKDDVGGNAKFIVRLNKKVSKRHAVLGKVTKLDGTLITLSHLTQADRNFLIDVAKDTQIKIKGGNDSTSIADIKEGDVLVASGSVDAKGTISASKIFVIPGKAKEATKTATPSSNQ